MVGPATYDIEHVTRYRYSSPVSGCVMSLCLEPRQDAGQRLLHVEIDTDPPAPTNAEADSFGNTKHVLNIHREHRALAITARATVEQTPAPPLPESLGASAWEEIGGWQDSFTLWDFVRPSALTQPSPALSVFTARLGIEPADDPLHSVQRLSNLLYRNLDYVPGSTSAISPVDHILESGRGVCQDYAHAMIAIARSWGVPTRYVSGYLHLSDIEDGDAPAPQTASHAWAECLLPELGWVGFDATNDRLAGLGHIRLAVGRDYRDVAPTSGIFRGGGESRIEVEVRVRPHRAG
ncbi:MAG: transglutaminase family protein [Chloroflexi bacterium]|nr:transglutaminase family protein [Chloroflexota bacterium]